MHDDESQTGRQLCCTKFLSDGDAQVSNGEVAGHSMQKQLSEASMEQLGADLRCHTVLLDQRLLGEVDLQGVICAEAHVHAPGKEGGERVAMVVQEQAVVGQGAHAQPHLHSQTYRTNCTLC